MPESVVEAAAGGDELASLEALRDRLAVAIDGAAPGVLPGLSSQFAAVVKRITELRPSTEKVTLSDELERRRQERSAS